MLSVVESTAGPAHVAVPLVTVAATGAVVNPVPAAVTTIAVPPAMVLVPVKATVAVALLPPPPVMVSVQVCVADPVAEMPLV